MPKRRAAKAKTVQISAAVAKRRDRVLDLAVGGMPVAAIAKQFEVAPNTIYEDIKAKLNQLAEHSPSTALYRQKHLHRITYLIGVWWERAHDDLNALDRIIRLMDREAKVLGLNAPSTHMVRADVKVEGDKPSITIDMSDPQAAQEYARMREIAEQDSQQ